MNLTDADGSTGAMVSAETSLQEAVSLTVIAALDEGREGIKLLVILLNALKP